MSTSSVTRSKKSIVGSTDDIRAKKPCATARTARASWKSAVPCVETCVAILHKLIDGRNRKILLCCFDSSGPAR